MVRIIDSAKCRDAYYAVSFTQVVFSDVKDYREKKKFYSWAALWKCITLHQANAGAQKNSWTLITDISKDCNWCIILYQYMIPYITDAHSRYSLNVKCYAFRQLRKNNFTCQLYSAHATLCTSSPCNWSQHSLHVHVMCVYIMCVRKGVQ